MVENSKYEQIKAQVVDLEIVYLPYTDSVETKSAESYERCEGDKEGVGPDEEEDEQGGGHGGEGELEISTRHYCINETPGDLHETRHKLVTVHYQT